MGKRPDHRMSRLDRAKQFSPFDALTGLSAALRKKRMDMGMPEKGEKFPEKPREIFDPEIARDDEW